MTLSSASKCVIYAYVITTRDYNHIITSLTEIVQIPSTDNVFR